MTKNTIHCHAFLLSMIIGSLFITSCKNQKSNQGQLISSEKAFTPPQKTLKELCQTFETDKCPEKHNYTELYETLFSPIHHSVKRLLEIGILHGASHLMWKAYFTEAEIYGIDLEDYSALEKKGIHTFVADQANREDLQSFINQEGGDFDIIIDDGGHAMDHQQISLGFLFKHLRPGGYYIIEDVHTSLPEFYEWEGYKVNQFEDNTTLQMIENYIRTSRMTSPYLSPEEINYLQLHIESVQLIYRTNPLHSIACVFQKKQ